MDSFHLVPLHETRDPTGMDVATGSHLTADAIEDHSSGSSVTYDKRNRRQNQPVIPVIKNQLLNGISPVESPNIFTLVEQKAQERCRAIEFVVVAASKLRPLVTAATSDEDEDNSKAEGDKRAG
ncbi:hypothetical protein IEQ34_008675 [Dendrobium chrysotoxum]|uniref:Uncharacterized protein n=1 Tax=Dendrobium chrysotoxum TaxID=161865 RepID=A0AAV7GH48_DENCH|nr:hypothetical protein IEQ34_008675 [Dendrobium chrysotoxum]